MDAALAVTSAFVSPDELARLPLRKPPKVAEDIRVVQVEGFDWSACGGTHVANTAQIGLIKIVATERRGPELRITFLCGRRARSDYARLQALAQGLVARFTTAQDELLDAVDRRAAEMQALRRELSDLEDQWVESTAAALWSEAEARGGLRIVARPVDYPFERAKRRGSGAARPARRGGRASACAESAPSSSSPAPTTWRWTSAPCCESPSPLAAVAAAAALTLLRAACRRMKIWMPLWRRRLRRCQRADLFMRSNYA